MKKYKVLIVDDSALIRKTLTKILSQDPQLEVVGTAHDPYFARDKIKQVQPDVITLDIEMPRMDGITFLEKLMNARPIPVVVVSSLAEENAEVTLQALELGAITCVEKPKLDLERSLQGQGKELIEIVKNAARARVQAPTRRRRTSPTEVTVDKRHSVDAVLPVRRKSRAVTTSDRVVAIGSSTGGTVVIHDILSEMPVDCPGIVVVQHMPGGYTASFAERLNRSCHIEVREAKNGDRILPGLALLAPSGTHHTVVKRSGANYHVQLIDGPRVDRHIPSVNVLFRSMAQEVGGNGVGVILTGMGDDGADGMLEMHNAGAVTIAQDEASCVVFGMPKEAIGRGAVDHVIARSRMARKILEHAGAKVRV
ncbi:MAG: chemotaxis response regulator protein-glutamate methylesterase [Nitrospirota bacterium]|nr:chemotaxis response regulator protein-glutamate methylesterase [Nitrospirota bacterium]